jgi:alanine racemase
MLYQTHVVVHLDNIRANLMGIRKAVGSLRKILIAVKANAYGHGAVAVSKMAEQAGMDWLGVATVPESIQLRQAGIELPILKLSPAFPEEMEAAVKASITLAVCDQDNAMDLEAVCASLQVHASVHMAIDTGMARIGVQPLDAPSFAAFLADHCPRLRIQGIFTHLPVSDSSDPTYTREQVQRFSEVVRAVEASLGREIEFVHCSNSGGVLGHPAAWMDLVRPGIMIYGSYPDQGTPRSIPLLPGLSFLTRVSFLKKVTAGTRVGYGLTWTAPEDTYIATIPVGYADGFNRLFSNRGRVLIHGQSFPVVGRVCMDQSMVNLGPETEVQVGDEVVLIGRSGTGEITVGEWAKSLGTIPYEVTCQINARVERIFEVNDKSVLMGCGGPEATHVEERQTFLGNLS